MNFDDVGLWCFLGALALPLVVMGAADLLWWFQSRRQR